MKGINRVALLTATIVTALSMSVSPAAAAPKTKVRFGSSAYQGVESSGPVTVTLTRTRNLKSAVTVEYTTLPGSAAPGGDYQHTSGTYTFPAQAPSDNSKFQTTTFQVPIVNDSISEPNETVGLRVRASGGQIAGVASSTLTIVDDDGAARFGFAAQAESAAENSGSVEIEVVRSGDGSGPAQVSFGATGGTAPDADWDLASSILSFAPGEFVKSFTVQLTDNASADGTRTLELGLSAPVGAELGDLVSTTLTILDDETPPQLRFEVTGVSVGEAGPFAELTVTRAGSYLGDTVTVDYATADATALAGSDYQATTGELVLGGPDPEVPGDAGEESVTIEVPITSDTLEEAAETFTAALSNPGGGATLGTADTATVTILDDDAPVEPEPEPEPDPDPAPSGGDDSVPAPGPAGQPGTDGTNGADGTDGTDGSSAGSGSGVEQALLADVRILRGRVLRKRGVRMLVRCSGACTVALKGRLKVRGARAIRLKRGTVQLSATGKQVVKLRLSKKRARALRRALAGRKRLRAKATLTVGTTKVARKRALRA